MKIMKSIDCNHSEQDAVPLVHGGNATSFGAIVATLCVFAVIAILYF